MVEITHVEASKNRFHKETRTWSGYVRVSRAALLWGRGTSQGKYIKNYLKEHYPLSKKNLTVRRWRPHSNIYDFEITFTDDAEEAEFIFTIKNLEGSSL